MVGAPVDGLEMDIGARAASKAFKEVVNQLRLQVADHPRFHFCVHYGRGATAEIYGSHSQSFVHWHQEVSGAHDAALVAQRLAECFAQCNSHVFHRVVLVNIQIAGGFQLQVESAVACEKLQHMIEEADSCGHL